MVLYDGLYTQVYLEWSLLFGIGKKGDDVLIGLGCIVIIVDIRFMTDKFKK